MSRLPRATFSPFLMLLALAAFASEACAEGGIFVGTTPCDASVRSFLAIRAREKCELIRWDLSLATRVGRTTGPNLYANVEYGLAGKPLKKLKREGLWEAGVGTPEHPDAVVYELTRGKAKLALWKVTDETVHLLDAKRRLLVGNGGWSYALSIAVAEKPRTSNATPPEMSYSLAPLATGPAVYGVFEGRTPCALAQVLDIKVDPACFKLKWRITLFKDAVTHAATSYRVEGSLFPEGARSGAVTALPGTPFDANAKVLRLEPPAGAQPIYLMRGDDNVLFFLDQAGKLGLGNRDFNYALSRRSGT
jgi:hypothetical protein